MSIDDRYADDESINNLLDGLIASAKDAQTGAPTESDATTSNQDVTFTPETLYEGVEAVNTLFQNSEITPLLPTLNPNQDEQDEQEQIPYILAKALTALVKLTRANAANTVLRRQSELSSQELRSEIERLQARLEYEKSRADTQADLAAGAKRQAKATIKCREDIQKRQTVESTELKAKLASAYNRDKVLTLEAKRREKECALLKHRVHTIMKTSRGASILPIVTLPDRSDDRPRAHTKPDARIDAQVLADRKATEVKNGRLRVCESENERFRDLLRAVQEELDELLLLRPSRKAAHMRNHHIDQDGSSSEGGNGSSVKKQISEGTDWETVLSSEDIPPAPSAEQMQLPFESFREAFEDILERKFSALRDEFVSQDERTGEQGGEQGGQQEDEQEDEKEEEQEESKVEKQAEEQAED